MRMSGMGAFALAIVALGAVVPTRADKALAEAVAAKTAAKRQVNTPSKSPPQASSTSVEWYDVQITIRERPARGARLVFGLVNGDVKLNNYVVVQGLTTAGGRIGPATAISGTAYEIAGGFRLNESQSLASRWIQQDVAVGSVIAFQVGVTKAYPWKPEDAYQPDQFSFAVLEASSNAAYLRSDDPTTANLVLAIDLKPGSTPRAYKAFSPRTGKAAWTVSIKPLKVSP